jgi:hypothetical protein
MLCCAESLSRCCPEGHPMRRRLATHAQLAVAEIVRQDEQNVGPPSCSCACTGPVAALKSARRRYDRVPASKTLRRLTELVTVLPSVVATGSAPRGSSPPATPVGQVYLISPRNGRAYASAAVGRSLIPLWSAQPISFLKTCSSEGATSSCWRSRRCGCDL